LQRREENDCILENAGGPGNHWSCGSGWGVRFYSLFCIAWGQRCLSDADRCSLGRRGVSLTTYHLLGLNSSPHFSPSLSHIVYIHMASFHCELVLVFEWHWTNRMLPYIVYIHRVSCLFREVNQLKAFPHCLHTSVFSPLCGLFFSQ
jgi:hypothetical protein